MEEFEPRKKIKIFTKEFYMKYSYVFIIGLVLLLGISYSYTFFVQNKKIASGSLTTAALTVTYSDRNISATNLTKPTTDQEGLSTIVKQLTITNSSNTDGRVKLTIDRTSGLNLTDMKYALVVNGAIQEINNVPSDGVFYETAILGNEILNIELRLWPKTDYSGSETSFVGEITPELKYLGAKASDKSDLTNAYVNFNCNGSTCEVWRIVGVQGGRLVLTREADLEGASSRTNSGKYDPTLTFNDDSMITSVSADGKNVYLAKTVKIDSGSGTQQDPYTLVNNQAREADKKVIATVTYKNGDDTVGTQYVYHGQTNYISQVVNNPGFQYWTDGTNNYNLGDTINFTTDTILDAVTQVWAVDVSYNDTNTNFNCSDFQCAIEALNDYVG